MILPALPSDIKHTKSICIKVSLISYSKLSVGVKVSLVMNRLTYP